MKTNIHVVYRRWLLLMLVGIVSQATVFADTISSGILKIGDGHTLMMGTLSSIAGGGTNTILSDFSCIGGGISNYVGSNSVFSFIGGGANNTNLDAYGVIGGGIQNVLNDETGFIGGGQTNTELGYYSAIAGGALNYITAPTEQHGRNGYGDFIGGGGWNTNFAEFSSIVGGHNNTIGSDNSEGVFSFIGGGFFNTIVDSGGFSTGATIAGGQGNLIEGGNSFIGAGWTNYIQSGSSVVSGGTSNSIYGSSFAFIDFGGINCAIGGGIGNILTNASASTIGGGRGNIGAAEGATIPGGEYAYASKFGQQAYASGAFASAGDAQTSTYVLRNTTTSSTQTELFLDGSGARMVLPNNTSWTFDILIVGRSATGGNTGSYHILGSIQQTSGTTALVGSISATTLAESVPAWDATAVADNSHSALAIQVTGDSSTVRWVATVRTVEVTN